MLIEIKPKDNVEYRGESRSGRIITIEKQGKGYMVRAYQIKSDDLLKEPLSWEEAFKVFQGERVRLAIQVTDEGLLERKG